MLVGSVLVLRSSPAVLTGAPPSLACVINYRGTAEAPVLSAVTVPVPEGTVQAEKLVINTPAVCVAPHSSCSGLSAPLTLGPYAGILGQRQNFGEQLGLVKPGRLKRTQGLSLRGTS